MHNDTSFKRPLSISPSTNQSTQDECSRQAKNSRKLSSCQVCGDKASIINYGALSCQSCKTFFRRNGFHAKNGRPCFFNRPCDINKETRRNCTACRIAKCLLMGMSPHLIRKEEQNNKKCSSPTKSNSNELAAYKQVVLASQIRSFDPLHDCRPLLIDSESMLISNVVHAHDTFSAMPQVRQIIERLSTLPVKMHIDEANVFEIVILMYTSIQSFIRSSPDFRILTLTEQSSLFERNLHAIAALNAVFAFHEAGTFDTRSMAENFVTIYGLEIMLQAKRLSKQLDLDSTIVKLMLIVLTFSSNCFIVDTHEHMHNDSLLYGTHRLLGSQNAYLELLWKYMIYEHGYHDSVVRFSRLIKLFLDLIKYSAMAFMNNTIHNNLVNNVMKKAKQSLVLGQNEQCPLWGK